MPPARKAKKTSAHAQAHPEVSRVAVARRGRSAAIADLNFRSTGAEVPAGRRQDPAVVGDLPLPRRQRLVVDECPYIRIELAVTVRGSIRGRDGI